MATNDRSTDVIENTVRLLERLISWRAERSPITGRYKIEHALLQHVREVQRATERQRQRC